MKKSSLINAFLLVAALAGHEAFSISQVGNARVGDDELGFSAAIPRSYFFERETIENGAILVGRRYIFEPGKPSQQINPITHLFLRDFGKTFPELKNKNREQMRKYFFASQHSKWTELESPEECLDLYFARSETADTLFAIWGSSVGVIIAGEKGLQTKRSLYAMAQTFVLEEGACQWPE